MSFPPAPGGRIGGISGDVELMLTLIYIHSIYSVVLVSIFSLDAHPTPRGILSASTPTPTPTPTLHLTPSLLTPPPCITVSVVLPCILESTPTRYT